MLVLVMFRRSSFLCLDLHQSSHVQASLAELEVYGMGLPVSSTCLICRVNSTYCPSQNLSRHRKRAFYLPPATYPIRSSTRRGVQAFPAETYPMFLRSQRRATERSNVTTEFSTLPALKCVWMRRATGLLIVAEQHSRH